MVVEENYSSVAARYSAMPSPFPGMDPYIEAHHLFEDFHNHLVEEIYRALSELLPKRYVARTGERSYVELALPMDDEQDQHQFLPDVAVASSRRSIKGTRRPKGSAVLAEKSEYRPIMMRGLVEEEYREAYLEIRQVDPDHKLITGIEVLSPSHKRPS